MKQPECNFVEYFRLRKSDRIVVERGEGAVHM